MPSDVTGTRAANGYEDGTGDENKVTSVRFYFFNGVGGAVNVKLQGTSYVNYYDWTSGTGISQMTQMMAMISRVNSRLLLSSTPRKETDSPKDSGCAESHRFGKQINEPY